jgi:hypothetical protein
MSSFRTIRQLVVETCIAEGRFPSYEKLTSLVREQFPSSKWKKTHYAWYKSKIKTGEIQVPGFPAKTQQAGINDGVDGSIDEAIEASVEASLSLERDLHSYLASRVSEIEVGLSLAEDGVEYPTEAGRIDLLAKDADNQIVVIELKAGRATDGALGQLLGYMGCLSIGEAKVRGILVASKFDSRVVYAARGLPTVKLIKYQLSFVLEEVT